MGNHTKFGLECLTFALGGKVTLEEMWPLISFHGKRLVEQYYMPVQACLCGF